MDTPKNYEHDCPFEAYITNLGKYNEGELVGEWVKFPTTAEELQKVFERIGIGSKDEFGNEYEEWFITDYDIYVDGLSDALGEYESLDELNYLASSIDALDEYEFQHFEDALVTSDYSRNAKTESSTRKVFLPRSVAESLIEWKKGQDEMIELLGSEYQNYNLVMATSFGMHINSSSIRDALKRLIKEHELPDIVFHSLRHTSVTYKLKLNGGDIKAVQGDSGHSQINMVTDVYSHIIDEDRRKNAELFENAFYKKENLNPQIHATEEGTKTMTIPEGVDAEALMKVLANPEMAALLTSLAKSMKTE